MKKTRTMTLYRFPVRTKSTPIPATTAIPVFVRSMRLTQYMKPRVRTSRLSILQMIFFCCSGVNKSIRASFRESGSEFEIFETDFSRYVTSG